MFNSQRLILGRKRRKMTARALAGVIGVSPITISRLENGANEPEYDTVEALARALDFPRGFFFAEDVDELPAEAASFRSLSSMTARERDAALSAGAIAYLFHDWVAERFNLPAADVPEQREDASPEVAAQLVRAHWGLGEQPVSSMIRLLESKGVRVFSLCEDTKNVDAFSCWRGEQPFRLPQHVSSRPNAAASTPRTNWDTWCSIGTAPRKTAGRRKARPTASRPPSSCRWTTS